MQNSTYWVTYFTALIFSFQLGHLFSNRKILEQNYPYYSNTSKPYNERLFTHKMILCTFISICNKIILYVKITPSYMQPILAQI